jgi:hypothetical protein
MRGLGDYPKRIRAEIRELVGTAHERDLDIQLETLDGHFTRWRNGEISGADLNELIHQYHHGPSREIWNRYDGFDARLAVAQAVGRGLIAPNEVSAELTEIIAPVLTAFRAQIDEPEEKPEEKCE